LGELHLLPSLPEAWKEGSVSGLRARGGFTVDMEWADGRLVVANIQADRNGTLTIRSAEPLFVEGQQEVQAEQSPQGDYVLNLMVGAGQTIRVSA